MPSFRFNESGQLAIPTAEELAIADEDTTILVYMTGTLENGQPYYSYVAVKPSRYGQFQAMCAARRQITLSEFGTVIASGCETSLPPEVIAMMRDEYGFDEHYLDKLRQGVLEQHMMFLKKREDKRIDGIISLLKKNPT